MQELSWCKYPSSISKELSYFQLLITDVGLRDIDPMEKGRKTSRDAKELCSAQSSSSLSSLTKGQRCLNGWFTYANSFIVVFILCNENWRKRKVRKLPFCTTAAKWWRPGRKFCPNPTFSVTYFVFFSMEVGNVRHLGIVLLIHFWSLGYTEKGERRKVPWKTDWDTVGRILTLMVHIIWCF